jgi:hypothetical protein
VRIIIDHPKLHEESGGQQNWGYIERFTDEEFVVKLEEGVFDYWIFPNDLLEWIIHPRRGDSIRLEGLCPGYKATGVRGPQAEEYVRNKIERRQ